jgi:uncharacterized membrane protein
MALFAAVGVSANVKKVLSQGISGFVFATITLFVHFITIGIGSFFVMSILPIISKRTKVLFPLSVEEVLVASNAAIGGASTAAGFASNISVDRIGSKEKRALMVGATIWGVFGYAIATSIGIVVTKIMATKLA